MTFTDRINRVNARSRRVSLVLIRLFLAWGLSAIVLALVVPALHARGIPLQAWTVWAVIVAACALAAGPDLVRRLSSRR